MFEVEIYQTTNGNSPLEKFMRDTQKRFGVIGLAKINEYIDLLSTHGMRINNVRPRAIKQIDGDLYELRPDRFRVFFFYFNDDRFVLLHGFCKKQQKTPKHEIKTAKERMEDYKRRYL